MSHNPSQMDLEIAQSKEMGFSNDQIQKAKEKAIKEKKSVLNYLLEMQQNMMNIDSPSSRIEDPEQRKRIKNTPVGLKNIGNTCYFNSLIQSYFFNPKFVKTILSFNTNKDFQKEIKMFNMSQTRVKVLEASIQFVTQLQKLFALMALSEKKYVDPTEILQSLVDDKGNKLSYGDEEDVSELNLRILALIDEALSYQYKQTQLAKNKNYDQKKDNQIIEIEEEDYSIMSSIRLLKNTKYFEANEFAKIFFGKMQEVISYFDNGKEIKSKEDVVMGPIILDVSHKDLYSSWESFSHTFIEDYRKTKGELIRATKSNWIINPPDTLCFQLQRVGYNKERGGVQKINDVFYFDKEIYIDRFLIENAKVYEGNQGKIFKLKSQISKTQEQINVIKNFEKTNLDQMHIIDLAIKIIENKCEDCDLIFGNNNSVDLLDFTIISEKPTETPYLDINEKEIKNLSTKLQSIKNEKMAKLEELENSLKKDKEEYQNIYSNMKKYKYLLSSILIHDGSADSGHYYSYIFDLDVKKWRRFNDIQVTDELDDSKVMTESYGVNNKSAYFLVYLSEKSLNMGSYPLFTDILEIGNFLTPNNCNGMKDKLCHNYIDLIPKPLGDEVQKQNQTFQKEFEDFKYISMVADIIENYQERFTFVNEFTRLSSSKERNRYGSPALLNFGVFLKNDSNSNEDFLKWHLLDCSLREISKDEITINSLEQKHFLTDKLRNAFNNMIYKKPSKLLPNREENRTSEIKFGDYHMQVLIRRMCIDSLELIVEGKCEDGLEIACFVYRNLVCFTFFKRLILHFVRMLLLRMNENLARTCETNPESKQISSIISTLYYNSRILESHERVYSQLVNTLGEGANRFRTYPIADSLYNAGIAMKKRNTPFEKEKGSDFCEKKMVTIQNELIESNPYLWNTNESEDKDLIRLDSLIAVGMEKYRKYFDMVEKVEKGLNLTISELNRG